MKRIKVCLFVVLLLCSGCATYERHYYHEPAPRAILLDGRPARVTIEVDR